MATKLGQFRDYDEHDVINLFTLNEDAIGTDGGVTNGHFVKISTASGWMNTDELQMIGAAGQDYNNTESQRYGVNAKVVLADANDPVLGMMLYDCKETDENGEKLYEAAPLLNRSSCGGLRFNRRLNLRDTTGRRCGVGSGGLDRGLGNRLRSRLAKRFSVCLFLTALGLLAFTGCKPPKVSPIIFRVMTYNIHHGEGLDGKVDLERIAKVINDANADAVALQEVDKNTERTGGIDMAADLAKRTNMHFAFGANLDFQGGKYGTAILSKHPIDSVENHVLKQARDGEPRGVLQAVLDVGQGQVLFAGTHLDHTKDQAERLFSQAQFDDLFAKYERLPAIFSGDFNNTPDSELHKRMRDKWTDSWSQIGRASCRERV